MTTYHGEDDGPEADPGFPAPVQDPFYTRHTAVDFAIRMGRHTGSTMEDFLKDAALIEAYLTNGAPDASV